MWHLGSVPKPRKLGDPKSWYHGSFDAAECGSGRHPVNLFQIENVVLRAVPLDDTSSRRSHVLEPVGPLAERHRDDETVAYGARAH